MRLTFLALTVLAGVLWAHEEHWFPWWSCDLVVRGESLFRQCYRFDHDVECPARVEALRKMDALAP